MLNLHITSPVVIADGDDVLVFREVSEAESSIELLDVVDSDLRAWDCDGQPLALSIGPDSRVVLSPCRSAGAATEDLRSVLVSVLRQHADRDLSTSSLPEALAAYISWAGYSR